MKTYEGAATLHPQLSKIKARSLSGRMTATQQRMTSYLLVAPRFQICHLQRSTWRLSQGRGPHAVPADKSTACLVECGENSAKKGDSQNMRGAVPSLQFRYPAFGAASAPYMSAPTVVRGLEDMLSSSLGQHILSYEPPRGFVIPSFAMYDGYFDPYDHMLHFNQVMILNAGDDRLLCKVFQANLKGPALA